MKTPDYFMGYKDGYEAAQPKWISVEEDSPKETGKYAVCSPLYGRCTAIYHHGCNAWGNLLFGDIDMKVTHWMPLPEPPEEEA